MMARDSKQTIVERVDQALHEEVAVKTGIKEDFFEHGRLLAKAADRGEQLPVERIVSFEEPDEVFGDVLSAEFTVKEAAEYLEVSVSTFRRYVQDKNIAPAHVVGRNKLFSAADLKSLKKSLRAARLHRQSRLTAQADMAH